MTMQNSTFLAIVFFNDTATTEIYTLSLHDALPIWQAGPRRRVRRGLRMGDGSGVSTDRKSTRLNSSHGSISYAVLCLQKNTHRALNSAGIILKSNPAAAAGPEGLC